MKRPKNWAEGQFFDLATLRGHKVVKRGWPDFACFLKDGSFILVEVKPNNESELSRAQLELTAKLASYGIPCYRWSPDAGFEALHLSE